ncbi:MAG: hypothetical protein KBD51_00815 [Candidatus Levybacteria bacterium]|nr:hypothetical protein [Candidatus Levybacteria bacterium]
MPTKDKFDLKKLLVLNNPKEETIYTIIGRMEVLLQYFKDNKEKSSLAPFLETYLLVTIAVAEKYNLKKSYFKDFKSVEKLDIYFASLYFGPVLKFIEKGDLTKPWQSYFKYTSDPNGIPFLQILLGINAHINADLYSSISKLKYSNEKDYFLVNDILMEVIPDVMKILIKKHDLLGFGSLIFKDFIINEFHMVIEKWRSDAWANHLINKDPDEIIDNTEILGNYLVSIVTEIYHHKNPLLINKINNSSVNSVM